MKNLLLVSYYFPPMGGGGVQRPLKFAKYLLNYGWMTTVLTVSGSSYWVYDDSLAKDIPDQIEIIRIRSILAGFQEKLMKLYLKFNSKPNRKSDLKMVSDFFRLKKILIFFLFPDIYSPWMLSAVLRVFRTIKLKKFDAIMSTSPPESTHILCLILNLITGVPWIMDLRDPWVDRIYDPPPTILHKALHRFFENKCISRAKSVILTSELFAQKISRKYQYMSSEKFNVIMNGYDPEDFNQQKQNLIRKDTYFTLLHAGHLKNKRTCEPLLKSLLIFFSLCPEARNETKVYFIGIVDPINITMVNKWGMGDVVKFLEPVDHNIIIMKMLKAWVLLLLEWDGSNADLIIPGKLFDYLASETSIIGIIPRGEASRLLEETGAGEWAAPGEYEAIAKLLLKYFKKYKNNKDQDNSLLQGRMKPVEQNETFLNIAGLKAGNLKQNIVYNKNMKQSFSRIQQTLKLSHILNTSLK